MFMYKLVAKLRFVFGRKLTKRLGDHFWPVAECDRNRYFDGNGWK